MLCHYLRGSRATVTIRTALAEAEATRVEAGTRTTVRIMGVKSRKECRLDREANG